MPTKLLKQLLHPQQLHQNKAEPELQLKSPESQIVSGSPNSVAQDAASVSLDSWRCCAVVRWRGWARSLLKICLKNKLLQRQRHPHPPYSAGLKNTLVIKRWN